MIHRNSTRLLFLASTVAHGFVQPAQRELLQVSDDPGELLARLRRLSVHATAPDDYRAI